MYSAFYYYVFDEIYMVNPRSYNEMRKLNGTLLIPLNKLEMEMFESSELSVQLWIQFCQKEQN